MFDLRIVNALLVTGDGSGARPGELGVRAGRIAALGSSVSGDARETFDACGQWVTPGFIDVHTHCVPGLNENYLQAGVTTVVGGNCGFSPIDIAAVKASAPGRCGPNLAMLIGHNSVRLEVMGNVNRAPDRSEMERMSALVDKAMQDGAAGFSTGLTYVPGHYTETGEVVDLGRVAAQYGGYYTSHMRNEAAGLMDSIRESAEIGSRTGLPVHISHLKSVGVANWGAGEAALHLIDSFRAQGQDITQDQYPYTASCGRIYLLFPQWAQEGGPEQMLARLADPQQRPRLKKALVDYFHETYGDDCARVVISSAPDAALPGRSLAELARAAGRSDQPDDVAETVLELAARFPQQTAVYCVFHGIGEEDVRTIMKHPATMTASDGWSPRPDDAAPHPRMFGTCPRVLGRYARDEQVFSMEEAVARMTGLPARRLGLQDRGLLREEAWADLVVFDPQRIRDRATFEDPMRYPEGIAAVWVNGDCVIANGRSTGALPGRFLR